MRFTIMRLCGLNLSTKDPNLVLNVYTRSASIISNVTSVSYPKVYCTDYNFHFQKKQ
jgi:hypothetical protein